MNAGWVCRSCRQQLGRPLKRPRRSFASVAIKNNVEAAPSLQLDRIRNIGIIAHIDAGKTTTTERMLYYSGFTRRIGDVDDGSTVTDFLPAERARGITIQSAAITFHWPPTTDAEAAAGDARSLAPTSSQHTINLIDTPGHADFTFEVIRSLRILDGAICILDGVAGVEAQTEKVWRQANNYRVPRMIFVNKLDREGATFDRTVKEIASRLHTFPALCKVPWWRNGKFIGVGDVVELRGLEWEEGGDGSSFRTSSLQELDEVDAPFANELRKARTALIEALTEEDDQMVESFLEANEDWLAIPPKEVWRSLRRVLLSSGQSITPVFAGASFRNIGVQPLLDAVNTLFPSPSEALDPDMSLGETQTTLRKFFAKETRVAEKASSKESLAKRKGPGPTYALAQNIMALALAFKVVTDPRRGVLVYVRVYHGTITRNSLLYNTNLGVSERSPRLLRMYASEAVEIDSLSTGQIGVIAGLRHARTGDTLLVYPGLGANKPLPSPIDSLQLRPIDVPPPLFFTSVEPNSLAEEKHLNESIALLLREDPSLSVSEDKESGQTHLSGMGELHLEIARDRLIQDFKVKATMGKIEISYRETPIIASSIVSETFDRDIAGKPAKAGCTASITPLSNDMPQVPEPTGKQKDHTHIVPLTDDNTLILHTPTLTRSGKPTSDTPPLPTHLTIPLLLQSLTTGTLAALSRGPTHALPINSTAIHLTIFPAQHTFGTLTTPAALSSAARLAVSAALRNSAHSSAEGNSMSEPVMLATIAVNEESMGRVVQDLSSARGAQVLGLDSEEDDADSSPSSSSGIIPPQRLSPEKLARVYAPPDPFASSGTGGDAQMADANPARQIRARVPLKEMVGYLKHLRSLTGGRGTFVMSVDRYERMSGVRVRNVMRELRGE